MQINSNAASVQMLKAQQAWEARRASQLQDNPARRASQTQNNSAGRTGQTQNTPAGQTFEIPDSPMPGISRTPGIQTQRVAQNSELEAAKAARPGNAIQRSNRASEVDAAAPAHEVYTPRGLSAPKVRQSDADLEIGSQIQGTSTGNPQWDSTVREVQQIAAKAGFVGVNEQDIRRAYKFGDSLLADYRV